MTSIFKLPGADPTMPPVPPKYGRGAEDRNSKHPPKMWLQEQPAARGNKKKKGEKGEQFQRVEIFRQETAAHGKTGQEPVGQALLPDRAGKQIRRPDPEKDRERIDGHHHRAEGINGDNAGDENRDQRGGFIVPATGEKKHLPGRAGGKHDREKTDAQVVGAPEDGAGGDGVGDRGALAEVTGIEVPRPLKIVGLVGQDRQPGAIKETERGRHRDDQDGRGRRRQTKKARRSGGGGIHSGNAKFAAGWGRKKVFSL